MSDWSKPTLTSIYTDLLNEISARLNDSAQHNRTDTVTLLQPPTSLIRWNAATKIWEENTGTAGSPVWAALAAIYGITAAKASEWTTGRTLGVSGDVSGTSSSWTGAGNATLSLVLATQGGYTAGAFGSASAIPIITVNNKGIITGITTAALGSIATQAASNVAITGGSIATTDITIKTGTAPTINGKVEWTAGFTLKIGDGTTTRSITPDNLAATLLSKTMSTGCVWNGTAVPVLYGGTGAADAATARTNLGIASIATQAANSVAITGGAISGTALTLVQSTTASPTTEGIIEWDTNDDLLVVGATAATKVFAPLSPTVQVTAINHTFTTSCNWQGNIVAVTYGGTGAATFASGGLLVGNGTSAIGIASAAQIVAAIGATAVTNATNATTAATCSGNAATATTAGACSGNAATATVANGLKSATTTIAVNSAAAPSAGQVLTATSSTAAAWSSPTSAGRLLGYQVFSATGNYTKATNNPSFVIVEIWGGGGGGGGNSATAANAGGGGAGGYSKKKILFATLGASETVTIGTGGTAGSSAGGNGGAGVTTSFGTHCEATGGDGGNGGTNPNSAVGGKGGIGGNGDINLTGPGGQASDMISGQYGAAGQGGSTSLGGAKPAPGGTAGGVGANAVANSGSGGSGSSGGNTATARVGGVGGSGFCIVYEYS